jgi:hypothetical protein
MGEGYVDQGELIMHGDDVINYVATVAANNGQTMHTEQEVMIVEPDCTITHLLQTEVDGMDAPAIVRTGMQVTGIFRRSGLLRKHQLLLVAQDSSAAVREGDELQLCGPLGTEPVRTTSLVALRKGGLAFSSLLLPSLFSRAPTKAVH